jgi:hypothetical protein
MLDVRVAGLRNQFPEAGKKPLAKAHALIPLALAVHEVCAGFQPWMNGMDQ